MQCRDRHAKITFILQSGIGKASYFHVSLTLCPADFSLITLTRKSLENAFISIFYTFAYIIENCSINGFEAVTKEKVLAFIYVAIESEPPYAVSIFKAGNDFIDAGKAKLKELYELYAECMVKNEWPGYSKEIQELRLPKIAGYRGD